ncbi:MAG: NAD-dependent epimerase/dehydratase family protein [Chitinivibrionales bacterium]|nr:NAD-dependent epimerase/dehydratase family protein [Chitinivibrionales bacterium]
MKYFVTGATGFIGGKLAHRLKREGHEVIALVRNPAGAGDLTDAGIEVAPGDITDKQSMRQPMQGVDGIYHVAALYKVGNRYKNRCRVINVEGTRNVLELMGELQIPRGVYTSTLAVFGDTHGRMADETTRFEGEHLSEYDRTKWMAHFEVAQPRMRDGLPLVIVMPGMVYGPGDTSQMAGVWQNYLNGKLFMVPRGVEFCWAHVDDIVEGHILAMEKGTTGESYIIAGERCALTDAMNLAQELTGVPAPKFTVEPGMLKALSKVAGVVEKFIPLPDAYGAEGLRVSAGATYLGSNAKARRELGYSPRPLKAGLGEYLESLRK